MSKQINLPNIKGYIQGNFRKLLVNFGALPRHIEEQFYYRITQMSEDCLKNGECPCQCKVPAKQIEDRSCENNCYPDMKSELEWAMFKLKHELNPSDIEFEANKRLQKNERRSKTKSKRKNEEK